ncbi:MAG TPA: endonuclease NucS domain-containing protein [candidate division Zixibacteria bacterium]|nr:endonuclease NucS domain-containing protein [candidate division Zixibacteria bacterium]
MSIKNINTNSNSIMYELYFHPEITNQNNVKHAIDLLQSIKKERDINFIIRDNLTDEEIEDLLEDIRSAALRGKFRVVSRGGAALAISKTKNLNFQHGPILIVREGRKAINVFPKSDQGAKGSRKTALDFLKKIKTDHSSDLMFFDEINFSEEDLRNLVIKYPGIIEENLTYIDIEVNIGSAVIDLVMKDKDENHLLLEFKLEAKDDTIGQLTRYNIETYAQKFDLKKENVRKGIVSLSYSGQIINACKTNNLELYIIKSLNLGFKK